MGSDGEISVYSCGEDEYHRIDNTNKRIDMKTLKKGRYQHFKGNFYEVVDIAMHSESQDEQVIYRALYGDYGLWIRPLAMFDETITRDGETFKRFAYVGDERSETTA